MSCRTTALAILIAAVYAEAGSADPPQGGSYNGVYVGGSPGSGHAGDSGVYIGGYSGGYHQGYNGVYQGGYPETSRNGGLTSRESNLAWPDFFIRPNDIESDRASIMLQVPQGADVWFDGHKTQQAGTERTFVSPPLRPGKNYSYSVRARWREGGQNREVEKKVAVHAGDRLQVNLIATARQSLRPGDKR